MTERIAEVSPRGKARIAGVFYLMVFLTGVVALVTGGRFVVSGNAAATATNILAHETLIRLGCASNLMAAAFYIAVTALFYELFKPVNGSVSLLAAFFSLVGCAIGGVSSIFQLGPLVILEDVQYLSVFTKEQVQAIAFMFLKLAAQSGNVSLVFFGFYCLLIGYLILRSTFLPRILGAGMVIAGLGWLTFLWQPLSNYLSPYNLAPGILGEGLLTLWLLVFGVDALRWNEQASAARDTK